MLLTSEQRKIQKMKLKMKVFKETISSLNQKEKFLLRKNGLV